MYSDTWAASRPLRSVMARLSPRNLVMMAGDLALVRIAAARGCFSNAGAGAGAGAVVGVGEGAGVGAGDGAGEGAGAGASREQARR